MKVLVVQRFFFRFLEVRDKKERLIIFATHNRYFANKADCKLELFSGKVKITNEPNKKKF